MCDVVGLVEQRAYSRAMMLGGTAAAAALAFTPAPAAAQVAQLQAQIDAAKVRASASRTRLILLGTAGGPTWGTHQLRRSFSAALVVGDAMYMVDAGDGTGARLQQALDPVMAYAVLEPLRALFFSHLHSDHTVDYPNLLLYGMNTGLNRRSVPLQVFGPGRRGEMEPVFSHDGSPRPAPPVMAPDNPTPGTVDMTELLYRAYATDINDRMRDNGTPPIRTKVNVHDIKLPAIPGFTSPNATPAPDMAPFAVYEDDRVRVTATLVNHAPIWPAFGFRFDTDDGSVVFSGDTGPCANLVRLAQGAQILVHEVLVTKWLESRVPEPRTAADDAILNHLKNAHTSVEHVGEIAQAAGAGQLVLSHIVPGTASDSDLAPAQNGYSGTLVIGQDLLQLPVTRRRMT